MARQKKVDIEKYCKNCGCLMFRKRWGDGVLESNLHFLRRMFCDRKCMGKHHTNHPKGGNSKEFYHDISRRKIAIGPCEICGRIRGIDVHHKDHDYTNNNRENLIRLCRSCHNKQHRVPSTCVVCGARMKGLGYCNKHYMRFKKYGNPLMTKVNQHSNVFLKMEDVI